MVRGEHLAWQEARYASGLYVSLERETFLDWAEQGVFVVQDGTWPHASDFNRRQVMDVLHGYRCAECGCTEIADNARSDHDNLEAVDYLCEVCGNQVSIVSLVEELDGVAGVDTYEWLEERQERRAR